jgi:hypothetical protein
MTHDPWRSALCGPQLMKMARRPAHARAAYTGSRAADGAAPIGVADHHGSSLNCRRTATAGGAA